jgi:hypothetical protein
MYCLHVWFTVQNWAEYHDLREMCERHAKLQHLQVEGYLFPFRHQDEPCSEQSIVSVR